MKNGSEGVHGKSLSAGLVDGRFNLNQESFEIVFSSDDGVIARAGGSVDEGPFGFLLPGRNIPAKAAHVLADGLRAFFEGNEDAAFIGFVDSFRQELRGKDGL